MTVRLEAVITSAERKIAAANGMEQRERTLAATIDKLSRSVRQELAALSRLSNELAKLEAQVDDALDAHPEAISPVTDGLSDPEALDSGRITGLRADLTTALNITPQKLTAIFSKLDGLEAPYHNDVEEAQDALDAAWSAWFAARKEADKEGHAFKQASSRLLHLTAETKELFQTAVGALHLADGLIASESARDHREALIHVWSADRARTKLVDAIADAGDQTTWQSAHDAYEASLDTLKGATADLYQAKVDLAVAQRNLDAHIAQRTTAYDSEIADEL